MGFPVGWTAWACLSFVDLCWECRTQSSTLRWKDLEASARSLHKYSHLKICSSCEILNLLLQFQWQVHLHQGVSNTVNLSNVTLAILGEAGQWVEILLPCRDDSDWWIFVGCLGVMYELENLVLKILPAFCLARMEYGVLIAKKLFLGKFVLVDPLKVQFSVQDRPKTDSG